MKQINIVALSLVEGGPLKILEHLLEVFSKKNIYAKINIYINSKTKSKSINKLKQKKNIRFIILKTNIRWVSRFYYEFFYFNRISKHSKEELWISLQDLPLRINNTNQVIYCHTPIHLYKMKIKDFIFEPLTYVRSYVYKFIYTFFLNEKYLIIVQQNWIKEKFKKLYNHSNIIVARPHIKSQKIKRTISSKNNFFFYPALPRFQKNHYIIIKAIMHLIKNRGITNFKVFFTIKKNENIYARYIYFLSKKIKQIILLGRLNSKEMNFFYSRCKNLIFPSFLETWGLPLSEATNYNMNIFSANLPYAVDTLANYHKICFFKHDDYVQLSKLMEKKILNKKIIFNKKNFLLNEKNSFRNWEELVNFLLKKYEK